MSLTIEPKKGIRLTLSQYSAIKTWQGGGKFWEHDFQLTVRQGALQEFLPRVTDEGAVVLYEQVVDGSEMVSASVESGGKNRVPAAQIDRLRRALVELKAKAEDPHCDANKRRMIEAFRLPDPLKDSELYRLYGSGRKKRLLVLWGVEKEAGSAIAPLKALDRMPTVAVGQNWAKWLWLILLFLLLAVAVLCVRSCSRGQTGSDQSSTPISVQSNSGISGTNLNSNFQNTSGGSESQRNQKAPINSFEGASLGAIQAPPSGTPNTTPPNTQSLQQEPGTDGTTNSSNISNGSDTTESQMMPSNSPRGVSLPSETKPDSKESQNSTVPDTQSPHRKAQVADTNKNGIASMFPPTKTNSVSSTPSLEGSLDTTTNNATGAHLPAISKDATNVVASANPLQKTDAPSMPIQTSNAPEAAAVPPVMEGVASRIKISAVPQGETVNDKVTVLLTAAGQEGNGALVSGGVRVTKWIVDNVEQYANGAQLTESTLPITLTKGIHRIVVEGISGGAKIRSVADVDVTLKHTIESGVTILPTR